MTQVGLYFGHAISPSNIQLKDILAALKIPKLAQNFFLWILGNTTIELFPPEELIEANEALRLILKTIPKIAVKDFMGYSQKARQVFEMDTRLVVKDSGIWIFDMTVPSTGTGIEFGLTLRPILEQIQVEDTQAKILLVWAHHSLMGSYTSSMVRGAEIEGSVEVYEYISFSDRNEFVENWVRQRV